MKNSYISVKPNVILDIRRAGQMIARRHIKNLVVDAGKDLIASVLGASGVKPTHMAIGDDNTTTTAAMTALQGNEHERVALDSTVVTGNEVKYTGTLGSGVSGTKAVKEVGLFNTAVAGDMMMRFTTSSFNIDNTFSLEVDWTVTIGD